MSQQPDLSFLNGPAETVAPLLLGWSLVWEPPAGNDAAELDEAKAARLTGRIVETEAYDQADAASHSYKGQTPRTDVMFGPAGHLYVYFTYGMHYCCNVVTGPIGHGSAVLIRAIEPLEGSEIMAERRTRKLGAGKRTDRTTGADPTNQLIQLTNGPAKLCQAFCIDRDLNGHDLRQPPLLLLPPEPANAVQPADIVQTTRIGISRAADVPWRFYIGSSPYVSRR
jgi:DNA-3-methyladenine glycosylase